MAESKERRPAVSKSMICAPQPEAAEAGALALRRGGNAVDAAITCALVQGVVDPQMCGIAGFGSMQLYLPRRGEHTCIDFHGKTPAAATPDMWQDLLEGEARDGFGFVLRGKVNDCGYQSITVPGSLKAYFEAQTSFGTMDWADVVAPAIAWAREGFAIRPHVHFFWTQNEEQFGRVRTEDRLRFTAEGRRIYFRENGTLKQPGDIITNPDMAATLETIAREGADAFYTGEIAERIDADMRANGGLLSKHDLAAYRTTWQTPLSGSYRGLDLATNHPPGGGVMLLQMLNVLEQFDLAALGHNTADYLATVAEAMKCATRDKDAHVGDPAFFDVPLGRLTSKDYAGEVAAAIRAGERFHVPRLGTPDTPDTTQISVADADGNAVSMTHSLGMPSGVITPGLGFMYNGCMGVFDPRPGRAGSIQPGKSRFSSICPSILFDGDRLKLIIGAPGGTQIAMGVLQATLNVVDFGMTMTEAVAAPRFSATSDAIDVCNRIPRYVTAELEGRGYQVIRSHLSYMIAAVHGLRWSDAGWDGGADPSHDGVALSGD
jgi:gamma-glutamyltranspeptidase/glutathione hydrolase